MTAEEAAVSYNYTAPLIMLASLGVAALVLGLVLKVVDRKKNLGLERPNITEPAQVEEAEAVAVEE